jgi:hypothetical protein
MIIERKMKLRPRVRRSTSFRKVYLVIVVFLFGLLGFWYYRISSVATITTVEIEKNRPYVANGDGTTKKIDEKFEALLTFAQTTEETALLKALISTQQLSNYLENFEHIEEDATKLSIVAKARANEVELIKRLESDPTKQVILAVLARWKRLEGGANNQPQPQAIPEPDLSNADIFSRVLSGMTDTQKNRLARDMSMDPENKWKPLPAWALKTLERDGANPMNRNCSKVYVPDHEGKYGGFTADCGWMIMSAMFSLENGECMEFPDLWGHGCDDGKPTSGWSCFFKPIQQRESGQLNPLSLSLPKFKLKSGSQEHRRMVRRDQLYTETFKGHRYPLLNRQINELSASGERFDLDRDADLLAWRLAFRWTFRPNDKVRAKLDSIERAVLKGFLPENIAGAHLRFGDKLGLKPGPREAYMVYQVKDFAERLVLYYEKIKQPFPRAIFVATDDYNASQALGKILGNSVTILTSADPVRDQGFSIVEYRQKWTPEIKFDAAVRLWADMEILSRTQVVLLSFQSNIGRTVQLMRFDKPGSTTISVDPTGSRCSAENRVAQLRTHNFWLCP